MLIYKYYVIIHVLHYWSLDILGYAIIQYISVCVYLYNSTLDQLFKKFVVNLFLTSHMFAPPKVCASWAMIRRSVYNNSGFMIHVFS